jgi:hypothetical protein
MKMSNVAKTFVGTLVVDDATQQPDFMMRFYAPRDDDKPADGPAADTAETVHEVIASQPEHAVASQRVLFAQLRSAGHQVREATVRDAVDDLIVAGRLAETRGRRGATGYRAVLTAAPSAAQETSA